MKAPEAPEKRFRVTRLLLGTRWRDGRSMSKSKPTAISIWRCKMRLATRYCC